MKQLGIIGLIVIGGCATTQPIVQRPPRVEHLSQALRTAGLYVIDGKCVGEFQARDGTVVRPEIPVEFCGIARVILSSTPAQPDLGRNLSENNK